MEACTFRGRILRPEDPGYDAARAVHNGLIDKRPAVIVRCADVRDVAAALALARAERLAVTVRAGGHNVAGKAINDGGLVVDVSPMKAVEIDVGTRRAAVAAGVTWAEFNAASQRHGLATTGGVVSTTGVTGLTLGGGFGWLMGKHGLAVDNVLSAEVVLADGSVVTSSAADHPELFWALRGGGGAFGVVTRLDFQLHSVGPTVVGGIVVHPVQAARDVLRFFRDYSASAPDELTLAAALTYAPDGSGTPVAALLMCHSGSVDDGEAHARELREFGSPIMSALGPIPYCGLNSMLDAGFPKGARNYWKSRMVDRPSDALIDAMVTHFGRSTSPMDFLIVEHIHGAAARRPAAATAFPHRGESYSVLVIAQWREAAGDAAGTRWARETNDALASQMKQAAYVNYLSPDEPNLRETAFGGNAARLDTVKSRYDPDRLFL